MVYRLKGKWTDLGNRKETVLVPIYQILTGNPGREPGDEC